jgi:hypothetical protein
MPPLVQASLAAQVAAQARPSIITPIRPSTLPPSTAPITLTELDQRFRALVRHQSRTLGEMVFVVYRLWTADSWESLGCADVESYCNSVGVSYAYWKRLAILGQRLQSLTLAEMQNLPLRAMESLIRVHPSIWSEYAWVEEAKALTAREFSMLVMQRNERVAHGQLSEPRTQLTLRVPLSQHPVLERRLETLRRQEKFGSTAEALTYALESVDRADLMADTLSEIQSQVAELSRIQDSLKESQAEKEARFASGMDDGSAARLKAQKLTAQILKTIGASNAFCKEEVRTTDPGATVSEI